MTTIPLETVQEVWGRLGEADADEAQAIAQQAQQRQPYIIMYLLAMEDSQVEEETYGQLLELGAMVMEVMYSVNPHLREVTDLELEAAEEANIKMLQDLESRPESGYLGGVQGLMNEYNQMPLLGTVIQSLMADYEDDPDEAPDNIGLGLVYMKTVIDCLDQ